MQPREVHDLVHGAKGVDDIGRHIHLSMQPPGWREGSAAWGQYFINHQQVFGTPGPKHLPEEWLHAVGDSPFHQKKQIALQ